MNVVTSMYYEKLFDNSDKTTLHMEMMISNFVLIFTGGKRPETEEESAAVMKAWQAWYGELG